MINTKTSSNVHFLYCTKIQPKQTLVLAEFCQVLYEPFLFVHILPTLSTFPHSPIRTVKRHKMLSCHFPGVIRHIDYTIILVVIWYIVISSFVRFLTLQFSLPRFLFQSTVICNIVLMASFLSRFLRSQTRSASSLWEILTLDAYLSKCLYFSADQVLY